ncbi:hypothetical protein SO802_008814 [Lithocarpus litseifolius]|uniref:Uncharacterized protein n=1 Tax=Lithocarpus litseifolius TaxID=425828 RepID=A0AAW2D9N9_9ROSI
MSLQSSRGKEPMIDLTSSPVTKRTRQSMGDFDNKRFKTLLDSQSFFNNFKNASTVVERIVRGKDFVITPDYLAKILHINHSKNVDISSYNDRLSPVAEILDTLGADHEVSSTGTSIRIAKFGPEMKTLTLIMFFNLYPLSNTGFITSEEHNSYVI